MGGYYKSEEDYPETLYMIQIENRVARVKDVAQTLNVKMPSVVTAIRSLSEKDLVEQEKYGHIGLTREGKKVGKDVYDRHILLQAFFHEVLGLNPAVAEEDACQMEHHLSPQTRDRLLGIMEYIRACKGDEVKFLKRFMHFVNTGEMPEPCTGCAKC